MRNANGLGNSSPHRSNLSEVGEFESREQERRCSPLGERVRVRAQTVAGKLTMWTRAYLVASVMWLICIQAVFSVMLFRSDLCQDCIDDEGLVGLDRWLLHSLYWFGWALLGLTVACLILLLVLFVARFRGVLDKTGGIVFLCSAGLMCLAVGVGSFFWFSTEHILPVADNVKLIALAVLFDLIWAAFASSLYRRFFACRTTVALK